MENKTLWSEKFEKKRIDLVTVEDEAVTLSFGSDGKIKFSTHHDQDCCEHVYGDFSVIKYYKEQLEGKSLREIEVKSVQDMGFLLSFQFGYREYAKILIPCYNYQNGYYSSNLYLTIKKQELEIKLDIGGCVEDHIY